MLRRTLTEWEQTGPTPGASQGARNPRVKKQVELLLDTGGDALAKTTTTQYDTTYEFSTGVNVQSAGEYDFAPVDQGTAQAGVIGSMPSGPALRTTETDYMDGVAAYRDRNLPGLVAATRVKDASQNIVAQSEMKYDEAAYAPLPCGATVGWSDPGGAVRGSVTTVRRWAGGGEWVETHTQFDGCGNARRSWDANGNMSQVEYSSDYQYAYPTSTISPVPDPQGGHGSTEALTTATGYDYSTGLVTSQTDANGQTTYFNYDDPLNRLKRVTRPDGGGWTEYYYDRYNNAGIINDYVLTRTALDGRHVDSYQYFDGLGRPTRSFSSPEPGRGWQTVDTLYDSLGRVRLVSNPYYTPNGAPDSINPPGRWTATDYDALSRVTAVTTSDGARVTTSYGGNRVTVTDPAGKSRSSTTDALGRLTSVVEAPGALDYQTNYTYDALSNLRKVEQGGQRRYFMYDALSRLLRAKNPEQSAYGGLSDLADPVTGNTQWSMGYGYDQNGNLTVRVDARGVTTQYAYDHLDRNTTVSHSDGTLAVYHYYDKADDYWQYEYTNGRGRLWRTATSGGHSVTDIAGYDATGRPRGRRQHFYNGAGWDRYLTSYAYNLAGGVTTMTYPSGRGVTYSYDDAGRLQGMTGNLGDGVGRTYAGEISYDERSQPLRERFGTDIQLYHKRRYNERGQLWDVRLSTGGDPTSYDRGALNLYYGAAAGPGQSDAANNGNVRAVQHWIPGASGDTVAQENYEYDELNRVRSATGYLNGVPTPLFRQAYSYDRWGNRTINTAQTWGDGFSNTHFDVEAATNRLKAPAGFGVMEYDPAGNLTTDTYTGVGTRAFDAENRMTAAYSGAGQSSTYTYDGDGRRVRRRVDGGGEVWQLYGVSGELLAEYAAGAAPGSPQQEYGYRAGELLIVAAASAAPTPPGTNLASRKPTRQLSTAYGGVSSRAVDGNTSGNWHDGSVTHTAWQTQPWWEVNLGSVQQIGEIRVWNRTDCCGDRLSNFYVLVSDQPFNSDNLSETINQPGVDEYHVAGQGGRPTTVGVNRTGRYVRVQLTGTNYLSLAEVEVLGGGGGGSPASVKWLVSDHLGTPRMVVDQTGSMGGVTRHDYLPFGEELYAGVGGRTPGQGYGGNDGVRQKFTGYERDDETELDYARARYYANAQGRFTSPDPLLSSGKPALPQSWNRYTYVLNNPLALIDPNGLIWGRKDGEKRLKWFGTESEMEEAGYTAFTNYVYENADGAWVALNPNANQYKEFNNEWDAKRTYWGYTGLHSSWQDWVPVWGNFRRMMFNITTENYEGAMGSFALASVEGGTSAAGAGGAARAGVGKAFATEPGKAVFWSGYPEAQQAAMQFANTTGGKTIEMTFGGGILNATNGLTRGVSSRFNDFLWNSASRQFAEGAS